MYSFLGEVKLGHNAEAEHFEMPSPPSREHSKHLKLQLMHPHDALVAYQDVQPLLSVLILPPVY